MEERRIARRSFFHSGILMRIHREGYPFIAGASAKAGAIKIIEGNV
jgi:hypothetical protein